MDKLENEILPVIKAFKNQYYILNILIGGADQSDKYGGETTKAGQAVVLEINLHLKLVTLCGCVCAFWVGYKTRDVRTTER